MALSGKTFSRRTALGAGLGAPLTAACAGAPQAQAQATRGYQLPHTRILPLRSAINGVSYDIYLRTPAAGVEDAPLILTLDADYQFAIAVNHIEHLSARMNQAPDAVVVSIAYAGQYPDRRQYQIDRSRDYTPVFWPDGGYGSEFQKASGGAPAFLRVIAEEVLPLIAANAPVDATDRTIVGHSYGGLFAAWLLCTQADVFSRYLLVSPSLWYADRLMLRLTREMGSLPRPTHVYAGVGSWEEQPQNGNRMASELQQFVDALRAHNDSNLTLTHRVFEDETHASIFPACFSTGIRHLFQN